MNNLYEYITLPDDLIPWIIHRPTRIQANNKHNVKDQWGEPKLSSESLRRKT